jgi:hypothetical protein
MNLALLTQAEKLELLLYEPGTSLMKWGPTGWHTANWVVFSLSTSADDMARFMDCLVVILPCTSCRRHAKDYILKHPIPTTNKSLQQDWLVEFHNFVNEKASVRQWSFEEVVAAENTRTVAEKLETLWDLLFAVALSVPFVAGGSNATPLDLFVQAILPVLPAETRAGVELFLSETGSGMGNLPSAIVRRLMEMHNAVSNNKHPLRLTDVTLRFASPGIIKLLALPAEMEKELTAILQKRIVEGKAVGQRITNRIQMTAGANAKRPLSKAESQDRHMDSERTEAQLSKWEKVKKLGPDNIRRPIFGLPTWAVVVCILGIVVLIFALIVLGKHIAALQEAKRAPIMIVPSDVK